MRRVGRSQTTPSYPKSITNTGITSRVEYRNPSRIRVLLRHPSLALTALRAGPEQSRRHTEIELRRAKQLFRKLPGTWNSADVVRSFRKKIKCHNQHNSYLYAFCRHFEPETLVETGVHHGISSAYILQALHDNDRGHLYSIDLPNVVYRTDLGFVHHDELTSEWTTGFAVSPELRDRWSLSIGDAKIHLPKLLKNVGEIDLFHHDSKHTYEHMIFEYETVWPRMKDGGLMVSDDVFWNNAFQDFCSQKKVTGNIVHGIGFTFKTPQISDKTSL